MARGATEYHLAQPRVTVGAHDQQIRSVRRGLGQQDLARVAVRLVDPVKVNCQAMPPQHRRRGFKARCGLVADRAQHHAFGCLEQGQCVLDRARGLTRPVPGDQDRLAEVAGNVRR